MVESVTQPDPIQGQAGAAPAFLAPHRAVGQRQLDVAQGGQRRQQVELLEHETDVPVADVAELILVHVADVLAGEQVAA